MNIINRIKNRLNYEWKKFNFKPYVIRKELAGNKIVLNIHDLLSKSWYDRPHSWPEFVWIKNNLLSEGDIIADCGCHNGFSSVFFAKNIGESGKVFGFEAMPLNANAAKENVELNGLSDRITIIACAVGELNGTVSIWNQSNSGIVKGGVSKRRLLEVKLIRLDDFFSDIVPDFLKIDVEGYELGVMKGAQKILKTYPKLDIEIHCGAFEDREGTVKEIFDMIDLSRYESWIQMKVDGAVVKYDPAVHTARAIAAEEVVHFFAKPLLQLVNRNT